MRLEELKYKILPVGAATAKSKQGEVETYLNIVEEIKDDQSAAHFFLRRKTSNASLKRNI